MFHNKRREFKRVLAAAAFLALAAPSAALGVLPPEDDRSPATAAGGQDVSAPAASPLPTAYTDRVERDFVIRTIGRLLVSNARGNVSVRGWAMDKIRVTAIRTVVAATPEEAAKIRESADFRHIEAPGGLIEIAAEYGRGLDIREKLRERSSPRVRLDLVVRAPANLDLRISGGNEGASLREWGGPVEIRAVAGQIAVERASGRILSVFCPACAVRLDAVSGSVRCVGGSGPIEASKVTAPSVYIESATGPIRLTDVSGDQIYVSGSASIEGERVSGRVQFKSGAGPVSFSEVRGYVTGSTDTASITLGVRDWRSDERALIESSEGRIEMTLPARFSAEIDARSEEGQVWMGFPVSRGGDSLVYGPFPPNQLRGVIGDGGRFLRIFSRKGDIRVYRGS